MLVRIIFPLLKKVIDTDDVLYAAADFDPSKDARDARKARVAKNDKQKLGNLARAQGTKSTERDERKQDIDRTLATTRTATASMGKFDKKLDGEKKLKGIKRKVRFLFLLSTVVWLTILYTTV